MNFHSSSFQVMGNRWIFSVNSPLPRRSELVSDWPKITRASVRRLRHLLFRISIMVERGVKSVGGGIKSVWGGGRVEGGFIREVHNRLLFAFIPMYGIPMYGLLPSRCMKFRVKYQILMDS